MSKQLRITLAVLLVVGLLLSACGGTNELTGEGADVKQVLNWMETAEPPGLDSAKTTDVASFQVLNNVMEGLYRLNRENKPEPAIAKDVEISADKKTYTFHLRDAQWSDGKPVTAHDFEYAWKRGLDPKTASEYALILFSIKNGEKFNQQQVKADDVGVKAVDEKTLVVELEAPTPYFLYLMAFATYFPQRQDIVEKYGKEYSLEPDKMVYNGPFVMSDWKHNKSFQLKKNNKYWDKKNVKLEEINFPIVKDISAGVNLYNTKKLDFAWINEAKFVQKYKDSPEAVKVLEFTSFYLAFNTKKSKVLSNAKIRKALSLAVDRQAYTDIVLKNGSVPAKGLVPPGVLATEDQEFRDLAQGELQFNPAEAKKLLNEGLKELGMEKMPGIELLIDDNSVAKMTAEFYKEQFRKNIGVELKIKSVPFKQRLELEKSRNYEISNSGWGADFNDPITFLELFITESPFNRAQWSNKEYDALIKKSQTNANFEERMQDLIKAEQLLMEEMPIAPIYHRTRMALQRPHVKDVVLHPFGSDVTFKWAYIEKAK